MTGNDTIVRPTVEQVLSEKVENHESIHVQTSVAGGKEGTGITMTTEWMIQMKTKRVLFFGGLAETRVSRSPIEPLDIPDRHFREVRKVARVIFDLKRFDGIELFDNYPGDKMSLLNSKKMTFVDEHDAVLWCTLEDFHKPIGEIKTVSLNRLEGYTNPKEYNKAKRNAQINSTGVWNRILHLILQVDVGHNAAKTLQKLRVRGFTRLDLEELWKKTLDNDELPEYLKALFPVE